MSANEDEPVELGLHAKYHVGKDGEPVEECFVLEPDSDPAARAALRTYAAVTDNDRLADDLREWLARYDEQSPENTCTGCGRDGTHADLRPVMVVNEAEPRLACPGCYDILDAFDLIDRERDKEHFEYGGTA